MIQTPVEYIGIGVVCGLFIALLIQKFVLLWVLYKKKGWKKI